ncbi:MAG: Gfo/Idh/MocA family oxidoreductase [Armatimonadetes bacterium]|nr:Gfo/Idh/MocA family oxidoreductase [Armatimonadota bacterium]
MSDLASSSRRELLKQVAVGAAAVGLSGYGAPAAGRVLGANERINIGVIGVGGMGSGHLGRLADWARQPNPKVAVRAVCDVWDKRLEAAKARSGGEGYRDYRRLLERNDIDAVLIATPDHWHAKISIEAMEAGKGVYCEKPMTLYWHEAKKVAETAARTKQVFQCGAQGCNADRWRVAQRIIQQGGIGKVVWSQTGAFRNNPNGDWNWGIDPSANPTNLDWDMWLGWRFGLASKRPWEPERYFRFRKFWDYSGGLATDLLYHALSHMLIALGPEFPTRVVATGGNYVFGLENDNREVPDSFFMTVDYPSQHTVVLPATQVNEDGLAELIRGQHATMHFEGPGIVVRVQRPFAGKMLVKASSGVFEGAEIVRNDQGEVAEIRIATDTNEDQGAHVANFLDCVRSREQPHLNAEIAYRCMVAIALGVASYREKKVKLFDPERQKVIQ